jgi:hypothetical protein
VITAISHRRSGSFTSLQRMTRRRRERSRDRQRYHDLTFPWDFHARGHPGKCSDQQARCVGQSSAQLPRNRTSGPCDLSELRTSWALSSRRESDQRPRTALRDRASPRRDKQMRMIAPFIIHYRRWQAERGWALAHAGFKSAHKALRSQVALPFKRSCSSHPRSSWPAFSRPRLESPGLQGARKLHATRPETKADRLMGTDNALIPRSSRIRF